jgi:hypothetical protein
MSGLEDLVSAEDRDHVARIEDPAEREIVVASLHRHRSSERLDVGDVMPNVTVDRLEPPGTVSLDELVGERPVVLVFGSYT